jgi:hypothetical protein
MLASSDAAGSEMQFSDALSEAVGVRLMPAELFQEKGAPMDMMAVATSKDVTNMANSRSYNELQHVLDSMDEVQLKTVLGKVNFICHSRVCKKKPCEYPHSKTVGKINQTLCKRVGHYRKRNKMKKGFKAHFYANVRNLRSVGQAMSKIQACPGVKKHKLGMSLLQIAASVPAPAKKKPAKKKAKKAKKSKKKAAAANQVQTGAKVKTKAKAKAGWYRRRSYGYRRRRYNYRRRRAARRRRYNYRRRRAARRRRYSYRRRRRYSYRRRRRYSYRRRRRYSYRRRRRYSYRRRRRYSAAAGVGNYSGRGWCETFHTCARGDGRNFWAWVKAKKWQRFKGACAKPNGKYGRRQKFWGGKFTWAQCKAKCIAQGARCQGIDMPHSIKLIRAKPRPVYRRRRVKRTCKHIVKSMTVYNIRYRSTGGFWKGLNNHYRDNYVAHFKGYVRITRKGRYTFWTNSDDGSRLNVNGRAVVNNDGLHGMRTKHGYVSLTPGYAMIDITFFERTGGAGLYVDWAGPGFGRRALDGRAVWPKVPRHLCCKKKRAVMVQKVQKKKKKAVAPSLYQQQVALETSLLEENDDDKNKAKSKVSAKVHALAKQLAKAKAQAKVAAATVAKVQAKVKANVKANIKAKAKGKAKAGWYRRRSYGYRRRRYSYRRRRRYSYRRRRRYSYRRRRRYSYRRRRSYSRRRRYSYRRRRGAAGGACKIIKGGRRHVAEKRGLFLKGDYIELGIDKSTSRGKGGRYGAPFNPLPKGFCPRKGGRRKIGMIGDADGFGKGKDLRIDYFLPGTHEERFSAGYKIGGRKVIGHNFATRFKDTSRGGGGSVVSARTHGRLGDLEVTQHVSLGKKDFFFRTRVLVRNKGRRTITDVRYGRSCDPDNTQDMGGSYTTVNKITATYAKSKFAAVRAESKPNDAYKRVSGHTAQLTYASVDRRAVPAMGSSGLYPRGGVYANSINRPLPQGRGWTKDSWIGIFAKLGNLPPGRSTTFTFDTYMAAGNVKVSAKGLKKPLHKHPPRAKRRKAPHCGCPIARFVRPKKKKAPAARYSGRGWCETFYTCSRGDGRNFRAWVKAKGWKEYRGACAYPNGKYGRRQKFWNGKFTFAQCRAKCIAQGAKCQGIDMPMNIRRVRV